MKNDHSNKPSDELKLNSQNNLNDISEAPGENTFRVNEGIQEKNA